MSSGGIGTKGVPRAEREEQIVAVAVSEFADRGYAGASMVDIATRAGISKPLVYQYFGSKDGLFLACLHQVAGGLLERLTQAEVLVDDSVTSRIHALQATFEALEPQRSAWRLLYDTGLPADGEIGVAAARYRAEFEGLAVSGSERFLAARGSFDADDAAILTRVWLGLVFSVVGWWLEHPEVTAAEMTERSRRLLGAIVG